MKYQVALLMGLTFAGILHLLVANTGWEGFFYVALPGVLAHMLVTGGHGGTMQQDRIGSMLEVATNTIFYSGLLWGVPALLHKLQRPAKSSN
jgi:hypothetical protein